MEFESSFSYFNDANFIGIDTLNQVGVQDQNSLSKFLKVSREFYSAHDLYVKALTKVNQNISVLANETNDPFLTFYKPFSESFNIFMIIQNELSITLFHIIKNLSLSLENTAETQGKAFNQKDLNIINEFKSAKSNLNKAKVKFQSASSVGHSNKNQKTKTNYISAIEKYSSVKVKFLEVLSQGFKRSQEIHKLFTENLKKYFKGYGNALAKFVFDIKLVVDMLKQFYRSISMDDFINQWVLNNKTVDDITVDSFPNDCIDSVMETGLNKDLIDLAANKPNNTGENNNTMRSKKMKKLFQSRKLSQPPMPTSVNLMDVDIADVQLRNNHKTSVDLTIFDKFRNSNFHHKRSSTKKRFSAFSNLKKFQSASDLTTTKEGIEDCWQFKNNVKEDIKVDAEGYIIRDEVTDSKLTSSYSNKGSGSGWSSDDEDRKKFEVQIRPATSNRVQGASKSELLNAVNQLPLPSSSKLKEKQESTRRVSNLRRSSRPLSQRDLDNYYRRSLSVSELVSLNAYRPDNSPRIKNDLKNNNMYSQNNNPKVDIACAFIEIVSSENMDNSIKVNGQLTIALPTFLKQNLDDYFIAQSMSDMTIKLYSILNKFSSIDVASKSKELISLSQKKDAYFATIKKEDLAKVFNDDIFEIKTGHITNRVSVPVVDYSCTLSHFDECNLFNCVTEWFLLDSDGANVEFHFQMYGHWIEFKSPITIKVNLVSDGLLEKVANESGTLEKRLNDLSWSVKCINDKKLMVSIKNNNFSNRIRLRLDYEFLFEKCNVLCTTAELEPDINSNCSYRILMTQNRALSVGNLSQYFECKVRNNKR